MLFGIRKSLSKGFIVVRKSPDGKEVWEKHTPSGKRILKRKPKGIILLKDALGFLNSIPISRELLEEYRKNPPSRRIDRLTRTRIITYWLFSSGEPFSRKEVNRIIRIIYKKNPPLTQDIPRIAQEVLDSPLFERVRKGYWRATRGSMKPKGRPPKPGALSAGERAFQFLLERGPYESYAFVFQALREYLGDVFSEVERLRQEYTGATDQGKSLIIKRVSRCLNATANAIAWMTDNILLGLVIEGLISESELRETAKRIHSTTLGEFLAELIRPMSRAKERELNRMASRFRKFLSQIIEAWKRENQKQ